MLVFMRTAGRVAGTMAGLVLLVAACGRSEGEVSVGASSSISTAQASSVVEIDPSTTIVRLGPELSDDGPPFYVAPQPLVADSEVWATHTLMIASEWNEPIAVDLVALFVLGSQSPLEGEHETGTQVIPTAGELNVPVTIRDPLFIGTHEVPISFSFWRHVDGDGINPIGPPDGQYSAVLTYQVRSPDQIEAVEPFCSTAEATWTLEAMSPEELRAFQTFEGVRAALTATEEAAIGLPDNVVARLGAATEAIRTDIVAFENGDPDGYGTRGVVAIINDICGLKLGSFGVVS